MINLLIVSALLYLFGTFYLLVRKHNKPRPNHFDLSAIMQTKTDKCWFSPNWRNKSDHSLLRGFHVKILTVLLLSYSNKWEVLLCISNKILSQIKICLGHQTLHTFINYQCGDFSELFRKEKICEMDFRSRSWHWSSIESQYVGDATDALFLLGVSWGGEYRIQSW